MSDLHETLANLFPENRLKWIVFHTDNVDRGEFALRNSKYEFHTDERTTNDNQALALLDSCRRDFSRGLLLEHFILTRINFLSILCMSKREDISKIFALNG